MEFSCNQVVKLRNGKFGVVSCFNGKPFQLVFAAYSTPIGRYNAELKHSNNNYDVVEIFDGEPIENVVEVFKSRFNADGLTSLWQAAE